MTVEDDEYLIRLIKIDPKEFGTLFDRHYAVLLNYIFHRVADSERSRDIASEVFLKAFIKIPSFRYKGIPVIFWLYKIANNEIKQYYRRKKYIPLYFSDAIGRNHNGIADGDFAESQNDLFETELQSHEYFILIQQKIELLPVEYQEVIALRYFERKTIHEISLIKGKKEGTIKSLLSRGISKLKKALNDSP